MLYNKFLFEVYSREIRMTIRRLNVSYSINSVFLKNEKNCELLVCGGLAFEQTILPSSKFAVTL